MNSELTTVFMFFKLLHGTCRLSYHTHGQPKFTMHSTQLPYCLRQFWSGSLDPVPYLRKAPELLQIREGHMQAGWLTNAV